MAVDASPGPGRVLVALTDGPLVAEPDWTRYDEIATCRCAGFDCESGRQSELERTDTGTARVYFHDQNQELNIPGLVGCQILLQIHDPVADTWHPRWRGHIDDINFNLHPSVAGLATVQFECVDIFAYLGQITFLPGMGDTVPSGRDAVVYYAFENWKDRLTALADNAGLDALMYVFFTGNISVQDCQYDFDDFLLSAMRDTCDAEAPFLANLFCDRFGRTVGHGRFARLDPEGTDEGANWNFTRWNAATGADVTTGVAQIREFAYNMPRTRIINSYLAWPIADENGDEFPQSAIAALIRTDPTSISAYGYRGGHDAPGLIIKENINNSNTGAEECGQFGDFMMANYATIHENIQRITFKAMPPGDARAAATWAIMAGMDISDVINVTVSEAAFEDVPYFIDGISVTCRYLNPDYDYVEVTPNLTPAAYYDVDVFGPVS